jgi:uncharacterized MAPEG superfamily protein
MEVTALALMSILFLLAFLPVSVGKKQAFGNRWLASNRHPLDGIELPRWAQRCERAHQNLKDNFPGFIAAILLLLVLDKTNQITGFLALGYVLVRIIHYVAYGMGNVGIRALAYFTGLGINIYLLIQVI